MARPITHWVLDAAMDQLAIWQQNHGAITLSMNISATNLDEIDLIERIQLGLLKRNVHPDHLEIEPTDGAIMDQPEQALATLRELADSDICLAVDDFRTGHSSLAYLQCLPAQVVQSIRRSFAI